MDKFGEPGILVQCLTFLLASIGSSVHVDTFDAFLYSWRAARLGAEVEIDPASCDINIVKFTVVDDFGLVINPMMLAGQIHGGIAQGGGQALYEHVVYDVSGQILSGSFMDYTMPRADHFPQLDIHMHNTPCQNNILGIKGSGEAGAIGAPQAVVSAVCDGLGIQHIDMPITPLKIFNILHQN